jgi:hypothetical protein
MSPVKKGEFHRRVRRETQRFSPGFLCDLCVLCGSKELFAVESRMSLGRKAQLANDEN